MHMNIRIRTELLNVVRKSKNAHIVLNAPSCCGCAERPRHRRGRPPWPWSCRQSLRHPHTCSARPLSGRARRRWGAQVGAQPQGAQGLREQRLKKRREVPALGQRSATHYYCDCCGRPVHPPPPTATDAAAALPASHHRPPSPSQCPHPPRPLLPVTPARTTRRRVGRSGSPGCPQQRQPLPAPPPPPGAAAHPPSRCPLQTRGGCCRTPPHRHAAVGAGCGCDCDCGGQIGPLSPTRPLSPPAH